MKLLLSVSGVSAAAEKLVSWGLCMSASADTQIPKARK